MFLLKDITILKNKKALRNLPKGKLLINTINAHSYNTALKDNFFSETSSEISFSFGISVRKSGGNDLLIRWRKYNETSEHLGEIENICTLASHSTEQYGTGNNTYKEK